MRAIRLFILPALLALAACDPGGSDPPEPEGGTFHAVLASPNGAEGAVSLQLTGGGIISLQGTGSTLLASTVSGGKRVVVLREPAGSIEFDLTVARGYDVPEVQVLEVVDGQDQPRASLNGYDVELTRTGNAP
jgi:hypothetical protein